MFVVEKLEERKNNHHHLITQDSVVIVTYIYVETLFLSVYVYMKTWVEKYIKF